MNRACIAMPIQIEKEDEFWRGEVEITQSRRSVVECYGLFTTVAGDTTVTALAAAADIATICTAEAAATAETEAGIDTEATMPWCCCRGVDGIETEADFRFRVRSLRPGGTGVFAGLKRDNFGCAVIEEEPGLGLPAPLVFRNMFELEYMLCAGADDGPGTFTNVCAGISIGTGTGVGAGAGRHIRRLANREAVSMPAVKVAARATSPSEDPSPGVIPGVEVDEDEDELPLSVKSVPN